MFRETARFLAALLLFGGACAALGSVALIRDPGAISAEAEAEGRHSLEAFMKSNPDAHPDRLAVVDFSKPSFRKRMVVIDLKSGSRRGYLVAHGRKSGALYATTFSDTPESNMSSLGLFRVTRTYHGEHGLALRLDGLDSLRNRNAAIRDIVLHSADYVSVYYILLNLLTFEGPRIGRSNGCFTVSRKDIESVAALLGRNGFIYAWTDSAAHP